MNSTGEKPLHWVASSKKDYQAFPIEVQSDMGFALGLAQLGAKQEDVRLIGERLKRAQQDYESRGTP